MESPLKKLRSDVYHSYSPNSHNDIVKAKESRNIFKIPHGVPDNEITKKAMFWRNNGEVGMSSLTMWMHLLDVRHPESGMIYDKSYPYDADDFRRCYLLLEAVPEWKNNLSVLKKISPVWKTLVEDWDNLTILFEKGEYRNLSIQIDLCRISCR